MSTFEQAIKVVLMHEGGWVNDPSDLGGETNFGISTLIIERERMTPEYLGLAIVPPPPVVVNGVETLQSIRARRNFAGWLKPLTVTTATKIYRQLFWDRYGYGRILDQASATKVFDFGVNAGPHNAGAVAQTAANACGPFGLKVDGSLGDKSYAAINASEPRMFLAQMRKAMEDYYNLIIAKRPLNEKFRSNWMHRAAWGT